MKRKGQITTVIPDVIAILVFLVLTLLFIIAIRIDLGVWVHGNDVASPEGKQKTFTVLGNYTLEELKEAQGKIYTWNQQIH